MVKIRIETISEKIRRIISLVTGSQYKRPRLSNANDYNKVAVVTGADAGIGKAIVRGLCKNFDGDVILTARINKLGQEAVRTLKKDGLKARFHKLELTSKKSIAELSSFLKEDYGGLDILVNNASRIFPVFDTQTEFAQQASRTIEVNYFGTLEVCHALFPLLRQHARVCHMSSLACVNCLQLIHPNIQTRLLEPMMNITELGDLMQDYVDSAARAELDSGYVMSPMGAYGMSKIGITVMTSIQQRAFDKMDENRREEGKDMMDIVVNAASPGYVMTNSNQFRGEMTPEEGAEMPIQLCLLPPFVKEPRGAFVRGNSWFSLQELRDLHCMGRVVKY